MKTILLAALTILPLLAMAQDYYEPFIVEGKVWHYEFVSAVGGNEKAYTYKMYFSGDTIIDGKGCKFLIEERPNSPLYVTGACYEEDGRVWMLSSLSSNTPKPRLLFDFRCNEGDTLTNLRCWSDDSFKVSSVDATFSFGRARKLVSFTSVMHPQKSTGYWLEGVGSRYEMFDVWPSFAASVKFLYCELDGEVIADQSSFGDAALETSVKQTEKGENKTPSIHDLQGRRLASPPVHGVYVHNGRKYVK